MPVLHIDVGHITARVSPLHAGLMTEEINHAYDGGLYAELVANRAFLEQPVPPSQLPPHWSVVSTGAATAGLAVDLGYIFTPELLMSLRLETRDATESRRAGIANDGFWGIPVRPATTYHASFFARISGDHGGPLTLSIESPDGATIYALADIMLRPGTWHRYEADLITAAGLKPTAQARFVISTVKPGTFWFSLVSLFPPTWKDRANGNRPDLMQKLADLHPAFLRFPGGNYLEGDSVSERFDWKKTLGDLRTRPGHMGPWGYRSSDGLGLLEFFHWCEDLNMEPVLGVFAGLTLKSGYIKPGPDLQPYVQDALDEIEYVTGDVTTTWGARRARDGHPAPFRLTYVEIGNEDWKDGWEYDGRFAQFYDAIKARYPSLQLIATHPVTSRTPDVLDDHYYRHAAEFYADVHHYDRTDRKGPKIFVGEWATMEGSPTPTLNAALGDAAWMTAMERNSDLIIMQAYAPLLVNVNPKAAQWPTNLIGYDALTSYGSPSYHAQKVFNAHRGDVVVAATPDVAPGLFTSVTRATRTGALYLKVVNSLGVPRTVRIEIAGTKSVASAGQQTVLTGQPSDVNSLPEPEKIIPTETNLTGLSQTFDHTFPAYSITVLQLQTQG